MTNEAFALAWTSEDDREDIWEVYTNYDLQSEYPKESDPVKRAEQKAAELIRYYNSTRRSTEVPRTLTKVAYLGTDEDAAKRAMLEADFYRFIGQTDQFKVKADPLCRQYMEQMVLGIAGIEYNDRLRARLHKEIASLFNVSDLDVTELKNKVMEPFNAHERQNFIFAISRGLDMSPIRERLVAKAWDMAEDLYNELLEKSVKDGAETTTSSSAFEIHDIDIET